MFDFPVLRVPLLQRLLMSMGPNAPGKDPEDLVSAGWADSVQVRWGWVGGVCVGGQSGTWSAGLFCIAALSTQQGHRMRANLSWVRAVNAFRLVVSRVRAVARKNHDMRSLRGSSSRRTDS